jgi:hypothetical protein
VAYWLTVRGAAPFEIREGVDVTIGRGQGCDLCLYSSMLSREHARIRWENGRPVLFDLESLNGTFLGLDKISRHTLRDGDLIRLGDITVQFRVSASPPEQPPEDDGTPPAADAELEAAGAEEHEPSNETRIYSRTAALHQRVFEYDELGWLRQQLGDRAQSLMLPSAGAEDLGAWFAETGQDEGALWELLRLGAARQKDHRAGGLRGLPPPRVAAACSLTKRAEKLRVILSGQKAIWNEMAALRYQVRQGPVFHPLRMVARAYRPGRGLDEVDLRRLLYEMETIYAPDLRGEALDLELRRITAVGFLCPTPGRGAEAWFPGDWLDGTVVIAPRGRAMLEGFRVED